MKRPPTDAETGPASLDDNRKGVAGTGISARHVAFAILLAALAARLVVLFLVHSRTPTAFTWVDSADFIGPARSLLELGVYAPSPERAGEAEIVRTPGYPLLIAATFALAGEDPRALSAAGALLATATALVLLAGMGRFFGARAAALGAALLCLDAGSFGRSLDLLSETLFSFLLVIGLLALCRAVDGQEARPFPAAVAGLAIGAAVLVRPILVYFPAVAAAGLFVSMGRSPGAVRRLAPVAAFLAPVVLLAGGWVVRNGLATGAFVVTPVAGHQLLHRRAASVVARVEGTSLSQAQEALGIREAFFRWRGPTSEAAIFGPGRYSDSFPETARLSAAELDRIWKAKAFRVFREHPVLTLRMLAEGAAMLLFSPPPAILSVNWGLFQPSGELVRVWMDQEVRQVAVRLRAESPAVFALSVLSVVQLLAFYGLAVAGALACRRSVPVAVHAVLLGALAYLVATSSGTDAMDDRFRVPLMPVVCLYAGAGLAALCPRAARRRPA